MYIEMDLCFTLRINDGPSCYFEAGCGEAKGKHVIYVASENSPPSVQTWHLHSTSTGGARQGLTLLRNVSAPLAASTSGEGVPLLRRWPRHPRTGAEFEQLVQTFFASTAQVKLVVLLKRTNERPERKAKGMGRGDFVVLDAADQLVERILLIGHFVEHSLQPQEVGVADPNAETLELV